MDNVTQTRILIRLCSSNILEMLFYKYFLSSRLK